MRNIFRKGTSIYFYTCCTSSCCCTFSPGCLRGFLRIARSNGFDCHTPAIAAIDLTRMLFSPAPTGRTGREGSDGRRRKGKPGVSTDGGACRQFGGCWGDSVFQAFRTGYRQTRFDEGAFGRQRKLVPLSRHFYIYTSIPSFGPHGYILVRHLGAGFSYRRRVGPYVFPAAHG